MKDELRENWERVDSLGEEIYRYKDIVVQDISNKSSAQVTLRESKYGKYAKEDTLEEAMIRIEEILQNG